MDNIDDLPLDPRASSSQGFNNIKKYLESDRGMRQASTATIELKQVFIAGILFILLANPYIDKALAMIIPLAGGCLGIIIKAVIFMILLYVITLICRKRG